jgi:uncharacterized protein (TIGR00369 family)
LADATDIESWQTTGAFVEWLGIEYLNAPEGHSLLRMPFRVEIGNRKGDIHGGVIASLIDLAAGRSVRSTQTGLVGLSTISLTTNYLRPGRGDLIARGECLRAGRSIGYATAILEDAQGKPVAQGNGAFRIILPRAD